MSHSARARASAAVLVGLAGAFAAVSASAQVAGFVPRPAGTTDFGLRLGSEHSDNIYRTQQGGQPGRFDLLGFTVDYVRDGNRVDFNTNGDIEWRSYASLPIRTEPVGGLQAGLNIDIVPQRFAWRVRDSYGTGRTNAFSPTAPQNRQVINVASTGPTVNLPVGGRSAINLSATRSTSKYENSNQVDNVADDFNVALNRRLTAASQLSFGVSGREITYDASTISNSRKSAYVTYQRTLSTGLATVTAGRSRLETPNRRLKAPLLNLSWVRDIGTRSRFGVSFANDYSDATNAFVRQNANPAPGSNTNIVIAVRDPYEYTRAGLNYSLSLDRTTVSTYMGIARSRYAEQSQLNNDDRSYGFNFVRQLRQRVNAGMSYSSSIRKFDLPPQPGVTGPVENLDRYADVFVSSAFGRRYGLRFSVQKFERTRALAIQAYEDRIFRLAFSVDLNP